MMTAGEKSSGKNGGGVYEKTICAVGDGRIVIKNEETRKI